MLEWHIVPAESMQGEMDRLMNPQREREQISGQLGEHFSLIKDSLQHLLIVFTSRVWALLQWHIRLQSYQLLCVVLLFTAPLSGCVLIACGPTPTPYGILPVHLPVPMATSNSMVIKHLQQHFQVVLVKEALCIAYDFITVFSSYVAQSRSTHSQRTFLKNGGLIWSQFVVSNCVNEAPIGIFLLYIHQFASK